MPTTAPPETILAHVRVMRLTDRLLDVAEELREARDDLHTLLEHRSCSDELHEEARRE
jgi:hypothetical protein